MQWSRVTIGVWAALVGGLMSAPRTRAIEPKGHGGPTPLILERGEGEQRVWRYRPSLPAHFTLKVDPLHGGSAHLMFGTETFLPGDTIETHKHPAADEILYLENGTARVTLGESVREVHGGATVFIPANVWISVVNIGNEPIRLLFIFSAPGFERFMRAESVREGEPIVALTPAQDAAFMKQYAEFVIYK